MPAETEPDNGIPDPAGKKNIKSALSGDNGKYLRRRHYCL
jgi:hypothetical protein